MANCRNYPQPHSRASISHLHKVLHKFWSDKIIVARRPYCDFFRHVKRDFNKTADVLATHAVTQRRTSTKVHPHELSSRLCVYFDGGLRDDHCGSGFVVWTGDMGDTWQKILEVSIYIGPASSLGAFVPELHAMMQAVKAVVLIAKFPEDYRSVLTNTNWMSPLEEVL